MAIHFTGPISRFFLISAIVLQSAVASFAQSGASRGTACRPAARAAIGALQPYFDEPWQFAGAGSVRACVTKRISVEPEVTASPGSHFARWVAASNVLVDLRAPGKQMMPYAIGGIGYAREHDKHVSWHRSYLALYGGVGVRANINEHLFVAPELRIGDDLGILLLGIGYQFGKP
jgi:hypothetical protein